MGGSESKGRFQEEIEKKLGKSVTDYKETILGNAILVTCNSINRTRGARNGALWSLFSIMAVAAVLTFAPIALTAGSVAYAALGVSASAGIGAAIGAAIGTSDPVKFYFDKATNASLGFSAEEAVKNAYLKAFQLHKNGEIERAKGWFKTASEIFFNNCFSEILYKFNKEAIDIAVDANTIFYVGKYAEAFKKFEYACQRANNADVKDEIKKLHSELANKKGMELIGEENFEEAGKMFDEACSHCPYVCMAKQLFNRHKRATEMVLEARSDLNRSKFKNSVEKFREAHEYARLHSPDLADVVLSQLINAEEKKRAYDEANVFYRMGKSIWEKAWGSEKKNEDKQAKKDFEAAKMHIAIACDKVPNYNIFTNLYDQIKLKIAGNERFNRGLDLQACGNKNPEVKMDWYKKAEPNFQEAMRLFDAGHKIDGDSRFQESYHAAEKSKLKVNETIKNARGTNFEAGDFCSNSLKTKRHTTSQTMRLLTT